ncbi:MAG: ring-cleaving dioxygenase [Paracoccaceae bacterium]
MLTQIDGLHHVTALASDAPGNSAFFAGVLGLRRVKTTVNFDNPRVYHLYYGDRVGTPGTVMTHFPFQDAAPGMRGTGETGEVAFSIPPASLGAWEARLEGAGVTGMARETRFDDSRLVFPGPDGERLALVEAEDDRAPWTGSDIPGGMAIRGLHSVTLTVADDAPLRNLLRFMGYVPGPSEGPHQRMEQGGGGPAHILDIETRPDLPEAREGAGSVHHIAFRVADRTAQDAVRAALLDRGCRVTGVRDRDYFHAIYFRTGAGILFEVATDEPGFTRDEPEARLGEALCLPDQHAHLREELERILVPLD